MKKAEPGDITGILYTSNYLDDHNPYFLKNVKAQIVKALDGIPLIVVSQRPVERFEGFKGNFTNINLGDIGRSHRNIYKQMLIGAKAAKTKYVALAEDDILYSWEHFHDSVPEDNQMLYDMNKVSLFTWSKPPVFSFRHNRKVVNQLIADCQYLIDALEERFKRAKELMDQGHDEEFVNSRWGDFGRYERRLGVTTREVDTFMSTYPSIVFSHPDAYGFLSRGTNKALGDLRIVELDRWGRAEDIMRLWKEDWQSDFQK